MLKKEKKNPLLLQYKSWSFAKIQIIKLIKLINKCYNLKNYQTRFFMGLFLPINEHKSFHCSKHNHKQHSLF